MVLFKPFITAVVLALTGAAATADEQPPPLTLPKAAPHHVYLVGSLRLSQPWIDIDEAHPDQASAYFMVQNRSGTPDRLTGASLTGAATVLIAPAAGDAPTADQGLDVPPNGTLILKPGDAHLVLRGLRGVALKGPPVEGVIRFERSGSVDVSFQTDHANAEDDDLSAPSSQKPVTLVQ